MIDLQISSSKTPLAPIPPPPLVQSSPPKSLIRQDSKNFNMVLQEYHVGHHGHSHHGHSHVTGMGLCYAIIGFFISLTPIYFVSLLALV